MIEYLCGRLQHIQEDHIIVNVGGVGYGLDVPESTLKALPAIGEETELHVSFQAREDSMRLYGFRSIGEKMVFEIFLNVSGIGPRTALDVLSAVTIHEITVALQTGNPSIFTRIPGIGRKKAERLVVELKDKVSKFPSTVDMPPVEEGVGQGPDRGEISSSLFDKAQAALLALGMKPAAAARSVALALRSLEDENPPVEVVVREALRQSR